MENRYDKYMDAECIELCDALNAFPGVKTTESCCGHLQDVYCIFFSCTDIVSLSIIARAFDRRYSATSQRYYIELESNDRGFPLVSYYLHSEKPYETEDEMMEDVKQLIGNLKYWSSEQFKNYFETGEHSVSDI